MGKVIFRKGPSLDKGQIPSHTIAGYPNPELEVNSKKVETRGAIAWVSHTFAPSLNGQALVLERLLSKAESVVKISSERRWNPVIDRRNINVKVATPWVVRKMRRLKFMESLVFKIHVWHRARGIARALLQNHCSAVVACTGGDLVDLPAASLAAERTGIPCVLHYFDDYCSQWKIPNPAWSMRWMEQHGSQIESWLIRRSAGVVVPNENMRDEIVNRTPLPTAIIRNPVSVPFYDRLRQCVVREEKDASQVWSVIYTGSIYEAQLDAVIRCALALETLRNRGIAMQLHLYTTQSEESLRSLGVPETVLVHPQVSPQESSKLQCESDILLLPLAFQTRYPELIRTSSPGKLGEYLASGRPILIHAPRDSFIARFATERRFAVVCDTQAIDEIAGRLEQLVLQPQWRASLVEQAIKTGQLFSEEVNREDYFRFIREVCGTYPKNFGSLKGC
jgi:hypothetical protein